jgi:hypothetical protein
MLDWVRLNVRLDGKTEEPAICAAGGRREEMDIGKIPRSFQGCDQ